jgi:hypothetical protein
MSFTANWALTFDESNVGQLDTSKCQLVAFKGDSKNRKLLTALTSLSGAHIMEPIEGKEYLDHDRLEILRGKPRYPGPYRSLP